MDCRGLARPEPVHPVLTLNQPVDHCSPGESERPVPMWVPDWTSVRHENGGRPDRIRTCDLLIKSQLLYQLSYGPTVTEFPTLGTE